MGLYILLLDRAEIIQHIHHGEDQRLPLRCTPQVQKPVVFLVAWKGREKSVNHLQQQTKTRHHFEQH